MSQIDLDPPPMLDRDDRARMMAPIAIVTALAALSLMFGVGQRAMLLTTSALLLWGSIILVTFLVPWSYLPRSFQLLVPLGYLVGVALLREAEGGTGSGYAFLVLVPVVMMAMYGRRSDLTVTIAGAAVALAAPMLLVGGPGYPASDQRQVIVVIAVAALVGFTVQGLVRSMRHLSRADALTGVANRRVLEERLAIEVTRARRTRAPLVVAYVDIDHFKGFNDRNGHLAGDRFLIAAGRAWQAVLRETDLLARMGGEEFVVMMPDTSIERAVLIAERLRTSTPDGHTSSVGLAYWDGIETAHELLSRADEALYSAKSGGRDRAIVDEPVASLPSATAQT